jgi:hypothetical protein
VSTLASHFLAGSLLTMLIPIGFLVAIGIYLVFVCRWHGRGTE